MGSHRCHFVSERLELKNELDASWLGIHVESPKTHHIVKPIFYEGAQL